MFENTKQVIFHRTNSNEQTVKFEQICCKWHFGLQTQS